MIQVKFYGRVRHLAGAEELQYEPQGPIRLAELLGTILKSQEPILSRDVQAILINGRNCIFLDGLNTLIQDRDVVEILPIVTGG